MGLSSGICYICLVSATAGYFCIRGTPCDEDPYSKAVVRETGRGVAPMRPPPGSIGLQDVESSDEGADNDREDSDDDGAVHHASSSWCLRPMWASPRSVSA